MRELIVLTVALTTAACATAGPPPPPARAIDPALGTLPLPSPRPTEPRPRADAPVPVPRPQQAAVEPFDLGQLGGATESSVVAMIGPPDEVRAQPPGKVWVYSHAACRLEVYLYPSVDVGTMAVLGTDLTPGDLASGDRDRCGRSLTRRTVKAR